MALEEIEKREHEDPDQIDKMPEKAGDFDAVGEVFRVLLIEPGTHRQHEVDEDENARQHMQAVQAGNEEVDLEVRVMPRVEHAGVIRSEERRVGKECRSRW